MLSLEKAVSETLAPIKIFCDVKSQRGQSGRAAVANIKKLSVIRAEWMAIPVRRQLAGAHAKAAFAYLLEHNEAYKY